MFSKLLLAATVAGLAAAAPTARDTTQYTLLAIRSGDPTVHQHPINFNECRWIIGLPTITYCPPEAECSNYQNTTSVINAPVSGITLYTGSPGFQSVYVEADNAGLQNTEPHSDGTFPNGTYSGPFTIVDGQLKFENQDFYACPIDNSNGDESPYRVTAQAIGTPSIGQYCKAIAISVGPHDGEPAFNYE